MSRHAFTFVSAIALALPISSCRENSVVAPRAVAEAPQFALWSVGGKVANFTFGALAGNNIQVRNDDGSGAIAPFPGRDPAISPDGRQIAYFACVGVDGTPTSAACFDASLTLRLINIDGTNDRVLTQPNTCPGGHPRWSPDGSKLVVRCVNSQYIVTVATGQLALIPNTSGGSSADWSPDGTRIVMVRRPRLRIVDVNGNILADPSVPVEAYQRPRWSPDGSKILYEAGVTTTELWVVDANGSHPVQVSGAGTDATWSPNGLRILYRRGGATPPGTWPIRIMNADGSGDADAREIPEGVGLDWWGPRITDTDSDGIADGVDNCPNVANPNQTDTDNDGVGDACDPDDDGDGVADASDNCPGVSNANQADADGDGIGDACDSDDDNDTVQDATDNCPLIANTNQADTDNDGIGNACDADDDNDGVMDIDDNCPNVANVDQADADSDGHGNACDPDDDEDGVLDGSDNCPTVANASQADLDNDGIGDTCDPDDDGDGVSDATDNCPTTANASQADADIDGIGDVCDPDDDNDGVPDATDNCRNVANPNQSNADGDSFGDHCDTDDDNDGLVDSIDLQPSVRSAQFNAGSTTGTLGVVPNGVQVTIEPGTAPIGIIVTYARISGNGAALVTIDLDNAVYSWQADAQNCSTPCVAQLTRSGNQVQLQSTAGSGALSATLYGAPSLITVNSGASATVTETVAGGALTDATVAAAGTAAVLANGLTIPTGMTAAIGKLVAKSSLSGGKTKSLTVTGTLTQSASSNGLDPLTETVVLMVGSQLWTVAPGGFTPANGGSYNYSTTVGGAQVSIQLKKSKANEWTVKLTVTPSSQSTPASIGLRVGNDVGVITG